MRIPTYFCLPRNSFPMELFRRENVNPILSSLDTHAMCPLLSLWNITIPIPWHWWCAGLPAVLPLVGRPWASCGTTSTYVKAMCIKVLNEHHLVKQEVAETLIISGKYTQRWCLCKRVRFHSRLIFRWQMTKHSSSLSPNLVRVFSGTQPPLTKARLTYPNGSKNNVTSFLKQSDVNHSQISDPLYRETKKDIITPIKRGWVDDDSYKGISDWCSETTESLALVF